ncbi:MAG: zinc ribbon domain-containing protein [Desulfobacteraceae bacterium]|nr:zinc ribbon domain-containing protein [Desulfobacteraceae bacterium]
MALGSACLIKYAEEEHYCPHCKQRLSCCQAPPFHVGDGLGWGSEVMFVCLNDDCPLFANSWQRFEEQYGHSASCRYMKLPGEKTGSPMMVGGKDAFKGCIVDPESVRLQSKRFAREQEAAARLESAAAEKNIEPALYLVLDEAAEVASRKRGAEVLAAIGDLACIDPIRNHKFMNTEIEFLANSAIRQVLAANYRKECPACSEIVKSQAKVCKHCGRELE